MNMIMVLLIIAGILLFGLYIVTFLFVDFIDKTVLYFSSREEKDKFYAFETVFTMILLVLVIIVILIMGVTIGAN